MTVHFQSSNIPVHQMISNQVHWPNQPIEIHSQRCRQQSTVDGIDSDILQTEDHTKKDVAMPT